MATSTYPASGSTSVRPHTLSSVATTAATGSTSNAYTYDNTGRTTNATVNGLSTDYTWATDGQLATTTVHATGGDQTTSYTYDATGAEILRTTPTSRTLYLGATEITASADGATLTNATRYYTVGGTVVATRTNPGTLYWQANDQQGTAQIAINATTLAATIRKQDPFGNPRGAAATWPNPRGFVGGTSDEPGGLVHLGARFYNPITGRFLNDDPVTDTTNPQQLNGYAYANNNPTTLSDPTGLFFGDILGSIIGGAKDFISGVVNGAKSAIHYIAHNYAQAGHAVIEAAHGHWGSALKAIGGVILNTITTPYKTAFGVLRDIGSTWWHGVKAAARGDWGGVARAGTKNALTILSLVAPVKIKAPWVGGAAEETGGADGLARGGAGGAESEPGAAGGAQDNRVGQIQTHQDTASEFQEQKEASESAWDQFKSESENLKEHAEPGIGQPDPPADPFVSPAIPALGPIDVTFTMAMIAHAIAVAAKAAAKRLTKG